MGLKDFFKGNSAQGVIEGTVKSVGDVVDRFIQTPDEKAAMKAELEKEISSRWASDMASDSWLSKNIRPLTLASVLLIFFILLFTDGNIGGFEVKSAYLPIYQTILITTISGYFVGRSIDKRGKIK